MTKRTKLMNPVDFFGEWAEIGKDIGMEKGHAKSVQFMIDKILENKSNSFTFLDAGCGNGWVVRKMNDIELCSYSAGLDGAKKMIEKAKKFDSDSDYFCSDLLDWIPNKKYDVIHSMEVFYYFVNPEKIIQKIYDTWLNQSGILVFGVDHYKENKSAINWPHECGVFMNTLSIDDWKKIIIDVGFKNITFWQIGQKNDWAGTLVFKAEKQH